MTTGTQVHMPARKLKRIENWKKRKAEKKTKRLIAQLKAMGVSVVVENEAMANPATNEEPPTATEPAPSGDSGVAARPRARTAA